jgi:hypothetical protein
MMRPTPRKHPSASRTSSADSCGCAMGARFMGVTLVASIAWFTLHRHEYSVARAGVRILIFAFAGAVVGKLVGIAVYRFRGRTLRDTLSAITRDSMPAAH